MMAETMQLLAEWCADSSITSCDSHDSITRASRSPKTWRDSEQGTYRELERSSTGGFRSDSDQTQIREI